MPTVFPLSTVVCSAISVSKSKWKLSEKSDSATGLEIKAKKSFIIAGTEYR